jgi:hypothetical protein
MRAQGLPLGFVIMGIILLVAMAVVLYIFTGGTGQIQEGLSSCEQQGGECVQDKATCTDKGGRPAVFVKCPEDKVCCFTT